MHGRIRIGFAQNAAGGIDPGDAGAGSFGKLAETFLLGKHQGDSAGFFGEFLAELVGQCLLYSLGDEIIDGYESEGENRHQAQDELTEDARGQDSLWH